MKDYKEMDQLVFDFGDDMKYFAQNHGGILPPGIKTQLQDLMYTSFSKEVDAIVEREELEIKFKKRFYDKLLKAKIKLAKLDRADAWFDRIFQKYYSRGLLEHLIVRALVFLHDKALFSPERLFAELNDNELLARFTTTACEHLGWTGQSEPADEEQQENVSDDVGETAEETEPEDEQGRELTVYETKPVQPAETTPKPVVTLERTVTHEVVTTQATPVQEEDVDVETDAGQDATASSNCQEKQLHRFHRPGGRNAKNL